jgi:hypothetical protein
LPAISTVRAVLERNNLVSRGRKPRYHAQGTPCLGQPGRMISGARTTRASSGSLTNAIATP